MLPAAVKEAYIKVAEVADLPSAAVREVMVEAALWVEW